ncbi:MAG: response regulator [Patescibacteria group bacterium]|nr:response regulator [Patescibacteria group bacterium]
MADAQIPSPPAKTPSSPKILLLEDEEMLAAMYKTKFEKEGMSIDVAPDGEAGLAMAQKSAYGIILVDIIMPKMDGFAALKALRALPQYKDTPIMMLTNLGQEEDIAKGKALGATDYLVKANFTPSQVLEKITSLTKTK